MAWRWDQSHHQGRILAQALGEARALAAWLAPVEGNSRAIGERVDTWRQSNPDLRSVELIDVRGHAIWSSAILGPPGPASPTARADASAPPPLGAIIAHGGWVGADRAAGLGRVYAPLHPPRVTAGGVFDALPSPLSLSRGHAIVLGLTWATDADAAAERQRHGELLVLGLLVGLALGFLLVGMVARLLLEPLGTVARAAAREDLIGQDVDASARRGDEFGMIAQGLMRLCTDLEAHRERTRDAQAQLEGALAAGEDGIAVTKLEDGRWRLKHANATFARFVGEPVAWLEGREANAVWTHVAGRLADGDGVRRWCEHALGDASYEGSRACALEAEGEAWGLSQLSTRPLPDASGRLTGRLWHVRDVTRSRDHEQRLKRQNQELATLDLMARRVSRSLDEGAVLVSALETMREVFGGAFGAVLTTKPRSCAVHLAVERGDASAPGLAEAFAPWRGPFEDGDVVHVTDAVEHEELRAALPASAGTWVGLPLRDGGGLVAVIVLARGRSQPFTDDDIALLRRLAHPVEAAVENARLFARTQAQLIENRTLSEVSLSVGRADELDALLPEILRVVHTRLDYRNAAILLPDEGARSLYVRASVGYHGNLTNLELPIDGTSVTALCFRLGHLVNVQDVSAFPGYVAGSDDIRSELALPLKLGERTLGILDVESDRPDAFGPDDARLLGAIANQAAMVIQNASLLAETRARATRFEAVNEIARAVSSTLDPRRLERAIVSQLARVVPCERYAMLRYDSDRRITRRAVVLDGKTSLAHDGDELSWSFEEGMDPAALVPHRAESLADLAIDERGTLAEARHVAHGLSSLVLVPIALDGRIAAAIVAASAKSHAFSGEQIRLLETVSYHVGAALKNAELYSRLQDSYVQLNEAQDGLVRSEKLRALGEMASGVAHDFNNVLGAILGRAQLLRHRLADSDADAAGEIDAAGELEIIEKAARDGASTVRRLQDFTRVRTDREFESVALDQVVEDSLSLTRGRWRDEAERAGVKYEVTTSPEAAPRVAGQASELREVLTNLILNALDAMPLGGALALSTRGVDDRAGNWVVVEVEDTGQGMPDDVRARIFDPFFTTKGVSGVGLGLSVVYGIVQRHGGRIEVESTEGQGTTMRIILPAAETKSAAGEREPAPPIQAAPATSEPLRILVVDDEPSVRTLLADLLRTAGHDAVEASSGGEALAIFDADPAFDLILTDLGMPELTGWDVARAVGEHPDAPPVVLVTGWGIQLDDALLESSGVVGVIAKPFTIEEVLGAVEAIGRRAA